MAFACTVHRSRPYRQGPRHTLQTAHGAWRCSCCRIGINKPQVFLWHSQTSLQTPCPPLHRLQRDMSELAPPNGCRRLANRRGDKARSGQVVNWISSGRPHATAQDVSSALRSVVVQGRYHMKDMSTTHTYLHIYTPRQHRLQCDITRPSTIFGCATNKSNNQIQISTWRKLYGLECKICK